MTACTFTGVQLCTRMMQFSCIYIALSLLQFAVTFYIAATGYEEKTGPGPIFWVSQFINLVLILLFIATVYCLCNLMRQFGGVLRDVKLVRRAGAAWMLSVVVMHFAELLSLVLGLDAVTFLLLLLRLIRPFVSLVNSAFFAVLFRSAYLTRQMLEREGEPEGRLYTLYTPLVPSPGPPQSAPISPVVSHLEMQ
mgnify:CR=1 FL=1